MMPTHPLSDSFSDRISVISTYSDISNGSVVPVRIAYEYIPQSNIAVHYTDLSGRVLEDRHENGTSAGQRRRGRLTFRSDMEAVAIYKM